MSCSSIYILVRYDFENSKALTYFRFSKKTVISFQNHPDMKRAAGGSRAENQKFIAILQAYQVLSKKDLRGQYDLDLQASERRSAYADKISNDMRQQNQYMR